MCVVISGRHRGVPRIIFYATEEGEKPVVQFLEGLRGKNDALHKLAPPVCESSSIATITGGR